MFFHGTLCVIFKDNLPMHEYSFIDNILSPPTHVTEKNDFEIQMTAYLVEAKKNPTFRGSFEEKFYRNQIRKKNGIVT